MRLVRTNSLTILAPWSRSTLSDLPAPIFWFAVPADNQPPSIPSSADAANVDQTSALKIGASGSSVFGSIVARLPMTVLWALLAQGLLSITRLLTTMTVGGRFGSGSEGQLGYYSSAFSLLMILIAIFEAFITTPLTVFNQQQSNRRRPIFAGHMLASALLLMGLLGAIACIWISLQLSYQWLKSPELVAALVAVCIIGPLQLLREFARRWLLANLQARPAAFLEFLFAGLFVAALLGLVLANQVTAVSVFAAIGVVNTIGLIVWWRYYGQEFVFERRTLGQQLNLNFQYGRWVAGENVCSALTMYFCSWYLMYMIDEDAAGFFFACFTVVLLANPFLLGICSILAPKAANAYIESSYQGLARVLCRFGGVIMGVLLLFAVGLWFGGEWLTNRVFGPRYELYVIEHLGGQNRITSVLGLAMPLMGLSYISAFGLLAINRPFENFYAAIAGLVVLVGMCLSFAEPTLSNAAISFVASFATAATCRAGFLIFAFAKRA